MEGVFELRAGHLKMLWLESGGVCDLSTKHFFPQLGSSVAGNTSPRKKNDTGLAIIALCAHGGVVFATSDYVNLLELNDRFYKFFSIIQFFRAMPLNERGKCRLNSFEMLKHQLIVTPSGSRF